MNTVLKDLVDQNILFAYEIDPDESDGGKGIVIAANESEAVDKIKDAYLAHGSTQSELMNLKVWNLTGNVCFSDKPDVLEIFD